MPIKDKSEEEEIPTITAEQSPDQKVTTTKVADAEVAGTHQDGTPDNIDEASTAELDGNADNPHIIPVGDDNKGNSPSHFEPVDENPDTPDDSAQTALDQLAVDFKIVADEFKLRFRKTPEDGEHLAEFLLKIVNGHGNNAIKWREKLASNAGKNKAYIQNKIIPTLVNAYNQKSSSQIQLPTQVNDERTQDISDRNGKKVGSIVIPEGFNQAPVDLGDSSVSIDGGYPAIHFSSHLIKQILSSGDDKKYLKKLLSALIKKIDGTPAAKALLTHNIFTTRRSGLYKVINNAATAKGIPMVHRPLKVMAEELVGDAGFVKVDVTPINSIGNENKTESICELEFDPMFEGLSDYLPKFSIDTKSAVKYGKTVTVPKAFLTQYYEILTPSGSNGLSKYGKFISGEDRSAMLEKLGDEATEQIKSENKNLNDSVLTEYLKSTNGVPLFYILVPRKSPKERIMVCDDYVLNGQVCVKSIIGSTKIAYFFPEDLIDALFDAG